MKVAKDVAPEIEPTPPPAPLKKELSMSTVVNYSIDGANDRTDDVGECFLQYTQCYSIQVCT